MNKRMIFKKIDNKYVEKLENTIKSKDAEIEFLKQQIALMKEKELLAKHKLFGSSSEKRKRVQKKKSLKVLNQLLLSTIFQRMK